MRLKKYLISLDQKLFDLLNVAQNFGVNILKFGRNRVDLMAAHTQNLVEKRIAFIVIFENDVSLAHLHETPMIWNNFNRFVVKIITYNF